MQTTAIVCLACSEEGDVLDDASDGVVGDEEEEEWQPVADADLVEGLTVW